MSVTSPSQPLALRMLAAYNLTSLGSLDSSLSLIGIQPYLVRCAVAVLVQKLLQRREGSHLLRLLTNPEFPPLVKRAVQEYRALFDGSTYFPKSTESDWSLKMQVTCRVRCREVCYERSGEICRTAPKWVQLLIVCLFATCRASTKRLAHVRRTCRSPVLSGRITCA
jgi:hypothetical protein